MNGQSSGAFRRALTDAVLEEYAGESAVPKASKRGKGNSLARAVRYAVLAAVLMATLIGTVLASSDLAGIRYPGEEAKNAHYENAKVNENVIPKSKNEDVHRPLDIPFRFKMGDEIVNNGEVFHVHWIPEDNGDFISFLQAPLAIAAYDDPETDKNFPKEIKWEKRDINGFLVTITYNDRCIEYSWNDGEYLFILQFIWEECSEEDQYSIFESISKVDNVPLTILHEE